MLAKARAFLEMIKFEHTVFALPFAYLGMVLAAGGWVAVTGTFWRPSDLPGWILLATLTLWIGGFDLIYACQDVEFDRRDGLHSIPARFGIPAGLSLARVCHLLTVLLLGALGVW